MYYLFFFLFFLRDPQQRTPTKGEEKTAECYGLRRFHRCALSYSCKKTSAMQGDVSHLQQEVYVDI